MKGELHQNIMLQLQSVGCVYHKIAVSYIDVLKAELHVHCIQQIFLSCQYLCFVVMYRMFSYFISIAYTNLKPY